MKKYYTIKEAVDYTNLNYSRIYRAIKMGDIITEENVHKSSANKKFYVIYIRELDKLKKQYA